LQRFSELRGWIRAAADTAVNKYIKTVPINERATTVTDLLDGGAPKFMYRNHTGGVKVSACVNKTASLTVVVRTGRRAASRPILLSTRLVPAFFVILVMPRSPAFSYRRERSRFVLRR
jgi:hypothetical protein